MKITQDTSETQVFVRFLHQRDRASLAELRRAAADPLHDLRDLRILGAHLSADDRMYDAQRLTAALFALYATKFWGRDDRLNLPVFDKGSGARSLGASLRRLRGQLGAGQNSLDLRFAALLNTAREDLGTVLRGLMQRLATADKIPIDFAQLLRDIRYWDSHQSSTRYSTRQTWARDYWQATPEPEEEEEETTESSSPATKLTT